MGFINETESEIFVGLLDGMDSSVPDLEEGTNCGRATIYRYLNDLEKMGLVESYKRYPSEAGFHDCRKRKYFSLTEKGEKVARRLKEIKNLMNR